MALNRRGEDAVAVRYVFRKNFKGGQFFGLWGAHHNYVAVLKWEGIYTPPCMSGAGSTPVWTASMTLFK